MDLEHVQRLAQAFAQGVAFARGFTEMAQDAKDGEEDGHWVTIGGERGADGQKHGGRPVFISGSGTIKKGLSKSAQGKTLGQVFGKGGEFSSEGKKSKPAQQRNESFREMARRHIEQKAAEAEREAGRSAEEKDKAAQLSNKLNMQLFSYYDSVREATEDIERSAAEQLQLLDKSGNRAKNDLLMSALHGIDSAARTSQMFLRDYYRRVVAAAEKGKIDSTRADKELDAFKNLADETQSLTSRMKAQISHIDDPWYNKRGDRAKIANEMRRLAKKAEEDIHNNIRDRVQGLEKGGEFSSKGGKSGSGETAREAGERASTKRAKAEKDRRDATSRAKEFRQETKQIVANDLEPSVAKLKKALDANVPARVHDDLVDMHRLADQIGIMANKLCSLNSRYAENSKEPSAFVASSHGQNAKGTAEAVANLARRSAALAHDFGKPRDERSYSDAQATSAIRDNLSELRGLHQDLLDHIRRIQEPEKREEPQEDPLYAARGKMINGPANAGALAEKGKALADLVKKEYGKVENKIRQDFAQTHKDIDKFSDPDFKIPGVNFGTEVRIKSGLNTIKNYTEALADQINMTAHEVAHAAEYDDFNRAGVENVWNKIKQLEKKSKNLAGRTDTAMHGLGQMSLNGHEDAARDITKLKDEAIKLDSESYDLYHEAIDAIRQYSRSRQE